ncbi:hypothetical protein BDI4_320076 [Burkholderia diffusa]|nr:hypothetical protein BDI4_320076 [Burkholderia diffusa]
MLPVASSVDVDDDVAANRVVHPLLAKWDDAADAEERVSSRMEQVCQRTVQAWDLTRTGINPD